MKWVKITFDDGHSEVFGPQSSIIRMVRGDERRIYASEIAVGMRLVLSEGIYEACRVEETGPVRMRAQEAAKAVEQKMQARIADLYAEATLLDQILGLVPVVPKIIEVEYDETTAATWAVTEPAALVKETDDYSNAIELRVHALRGPAAFQIRIEDQRTSSNLFGRDGGRTYDAATPEEAGALVNRLLTSLPEGRS